MADEYSDLDEATLEAKLAEATSYDERSALRKELRARKKQRGDGAAVAVRRGATGYNRFRTSNTSGKQKQQFIPAVAAAGGGGERKSPSVTPVRSTTPSSTTSPAPLSPAPQTTSPLPPSPQPTTPSPLPENEPIEEEKENERVDEQQQEEEEEEEKKEEESRTEPDDQSEEWQMVDKEKAKELEREARIKARIAARSQEQHDGGSPFKVQLRSHDSPKTATTSSSTKTDQPKAEFQGYKLRKTPSQSKEDSKPATTSSPRTLADYQRVTNKPKTTATAEKISNPKEHEYLVNYVNSTLLLAISPDGSELYDTCCNPSTICKLINKSVRNTVDMRALTKTPPPSKVADREEALRENMTLAVESARAIGCAVDDETEEKLIGKDRETFRHLLFDLIRARLVHKPGMDNAPSSLFESLPLMMEKLGLSSVETTDDGEDRNWREADVDELRKEVEKNEETPASPTSSSWRDNPQPSDPKPSVDISKASLDDNLSYEERAAIRKAERERRRKEREALATAK